MSKNESQLQFSYYFLIPDLIPPNQTQLNIKLVLLLTPVLKN